MTDTPASLSSYTDTDLAFTLTERGSIRKAAELLGVPRSTLANELKRRGIESPKASPARKKLPAVTKESLEAVMEPSNSCKVKTFLDRLDPTSREVVNEALGYKSADLNARQLRAWLTTVGFKEDELPSQGAITDHRNGRRPCRCHD